MAEPGVASFLKPGTHASTFGGNSLGCAAGIAAWQAMEEENVLGNVKALGAWLDERLAGLVKSGVVKEVRRAGFMIGLELPASGVEIVADCRANGLLVNCAHQTVIRLLPALNITREELDRGLSILEACLERASRKQ